MNRINTIESKIEGQHAPSLGWGRVVEEGQKVTTHGYGTLTIYIRKHEIKRIEPKLIIE